MGTVGTPAAHERPVNMTPMFHTIGIVGLGLIGGSIALAARQLWPEGRVIAVDQPGVLDAALRMQAIDVAASDVAALADADLVVLAAPVKQNLLLLDQVGRVMKPSAVVTDTGSTKRDIVAAARRLPASVTFIGGHPLGGAAAGGLDHARADLFKDRPWLFTPVEMTAKTAEVIEQLSAFVSALGATPIVMDVDAHDRCLAYISHLPQFTASALMDVVGEAMGADGLALVGRGLIDTTRLASSPPAIWTDIAASNADHIGPALDLLIARLQELRRDLHSGDAVQQTFTRAVRWRDQILGRS